MLKENQIIKIKPSRNGKNSQNLSEGKYILSDDGCYYIDPQDLSYNSHVRVKVICDMCGDELGMEYRQYTHKSEKYGDGKYYCKKCAAKTDIIRQKRMQGMLDSFGVINPMYDPAIKKKCMEACSKNGSVPTSKAQKEIFNILCKYYDKCELNFLEANMFLDCAIFINNQKIDIEYDGWYWHQDAQKDNDRDTILISKGYKILRIKGGKKPPQETELLEGIKMLLQTNEEYYEIILPDYKEITN